MTPSPAAILSRRLFAGAVAVLAAVSSTALADEQAKRLQSQVEAAVAKVNQSPDMLKKLGDLQKQGDTAGAMTLLQGLGAPNSLKIRGFEGSPGASPSAVGVKCKYYDQPVYISCTLVTQ